MRKFLVWKSRFLLDSSFLDLFLRVFLIFFLLGVDIDVFCYLFICIYYVFMYQSVYSISILIYFDIFFKNPHVYHMGTFRTQVILCSYLFRFKLQFRYSNIVSFKKLLISSEGSWTAYGTMVAWISQRLSLFLFFVGILIWSSIFRKLTKL